MARSPARSRSRAGVRPAATAFDGEVFFSDNGRGLWKSDGTEAGTVEVSGTPPTIRGFVAAGGTLYFLAQDEVQGPCSGE